MLCVLEGHGNADSSQDTCGNAYFGFPGNHYSQWVRVRDLRQLEARESARCNVGSSLTMWPLFINAVHVWYGVVWCGVVLCGVVSASELA